MTAIAMHPDDRPTSVVDFRNMILSDKASAALPARPNPSRATSRSATWFAITWCG